MASSRIISRLLVPTTLSRLSTIGNTSGPVRHFFSRNPRNLPDTFLASSSNVFRDLEREFERMQKQFENYFGSGNNNQSLVNHSPGITNENNDMIVTQSDGSRKFHLAFDTRGFEPEEVKIRTQNGTLIVSAKKEKKADNSYSLHEFSQTYTLPKDLKLDDLKSTFTENGVLSIEAPLPKVEPKDHQIQIEHLK